MRNFGRSLMRNYVMPTQATPARTNLPPSWSDNTQTPLVWRKEAPPTPAADEAPAEMLDTPPFEPTAPQRPAAPIQHRPAPAAQPQRQPIQRAKTQSEIDATLSQILAFHQARDAEREKIREAKQAQVTPKPDETLKQETPSSLRRRRAAVEYLETAALQSPEDRAAQKQEPAPDADVQRELSPQQPDEEENPELPEAVDKTAFITSETSTLDIPVQRQTAGESAPQKNDYVAGDSTDYTAEPAVVENDYSDTPDFIETPSPSAANIRHGQRSPVPPSQPPSEQETAPAESWSSEYDGDIPALTDTTGAPVEQVQRTEEVPTSAETKPPAPVAPELPDSAVMESPYSQSVTNFDPSESSPATIEPDTASSFIDTIEDQPRSDTPTERVQRSPKDTGSASAPDIPTFPESPHDWQDYMPDEDDDDTTFTDTIPDDDLQREPSESSPDTTYQADALTFPTATENDGQDDMPYTETVQRVPADTPSQPDSPAYADEPHGDWPDDIPYAKTIQRVPADTPSQQPDSPAYADERHNDWPDTPTYADESHDEWDYPDTEPNTIQRTADTSSGSEAINDTPAKAASGDDSDSYPGEPTETSHYFSAPEEELADSWIGDSEPQYTDFDLQNSQTTETDFYTESSDFPVHDSVSDPSQSHPTPQRNLPHNIVDEFVRRTADEAEMWRAPEAPPLDSEFITHVPDSWGAPRQPEAVDETIQPTVEPTDPTDTASPFSVRDTSDTPPAPSPVAPIVQRTPAGDTEPDTESPAHIEDSGNQPYTEDNTEQGLDVFQALMQSGVVPPQPNNLPDISRQTIYEIEQRISGEDDTAEPSPPPPPPENTMQAYSPKWPETFSAHPIIDEQDFAEPESPGATYTNPPVEPPHRPVSTAQPPAPINDQIRRVEDDSSLMGTEPDVETGEDNIDIDQLAQDVYRILRNRLRVERERRDKS